LSSSPTRTRESLTRFLVEGATGRLTAREFSGGVVDVYVMNGQVLAAHAEDDEDQLLRRLQVLGYLTRPQADEIRAGPRDVPIEDRLYSVAGEEQLLEVLFGRFQDNLTRFLACDGPAAFTEMEAIFVSNLQFSHDTDRLLTEAIEVLDRTAGLLADPPDLVVLRPGSQAPGLPSEEVLLRLVKGGSTLEELLAVSPYEGFETLDVLADMIRREALYTAVELSDSNIEELSEAEGDPDRPDSEEPADPVVGEDDDTVRFLGPSLEETEDQDTPIPLSREGFSKGPDEEIGDDELAMFADYDQVRGSLGDGQFTGEVKDRVDLTDVLIPSRMDPEPEPVVQDPIELGSAEGAELGSGPVARVQMNFTGPRLTNQEALRKLEVVNNVLSELCRAFDAMSGSGSGQAQVQLLVDGSPAGFSLLFYQVEARRDGTVNPNAILHNLRRRPAAEHRRLLNSGLLDLIERALSSAAEALDDDDLDGVLEAIAGYQQAIGL